MFKKTLFLGLSVAILGLFGTTASADVISGPNMDPMATGLVFGGNDLFAFGATPWGASGGNTAGGNSFAILNFGVGDGGGHGNSVPIDPATDLPAAAGGVISAGDVFRYSMWIMNNPMDPVTGLPGTAPLLKFEFHDNQLDGAATMRQFDTEVDGGLFTTIDPTVPDWTQYFFEYEVDAADFTGAGLGAIMEVRAVLFAGQFGGAGAGAGSYRMDNIAVEWFDDAAAAGLVDPLVSNPAPVQIPEPTSALVLLSLVGLGFRRSRG